MQALGAAEHRGHAPRSVVRTTLLYGSCSVSDTPQVWQWVRSISDCGFFGSNCAMTRCHSRRAARSLATSMKKFMPMAKKKDSRGGELVDVEARGRWRRARTPSRRRW